MILVGKDGKVLSIAAQGEELDKLLAEQLGSAEKKAEGKLKLKVEKKADGKAGDR